MKSVGKKSVVKLPAIGFVSGCLCTFDLIVFAAMKSVGKKSVAKPPALGFVSGLPLYF